MELLWVDAEEAAVMLTFRDHGMAVEKVLADMRRSGHEVRGCLM